MSVPKVHDEAATRVAVDIGVLRTAADLVASRGELGRMAYDRGRLDGYDDGWRDGIRAGAQRRSAA
jgi:hypothetical protein